MSDHGRPRYHHSTVRRQMERVSRDLEYRQRKSWIDRILSLLESDSLISAAAARPKTGDGLTFECNFAAEVWDDSRIERRVQQLAASEITVELVDYEHEIAGKTFQRTQIRVVF